MPFFILLSTILLKYLFFSFGSIREFVIILEPFVQLEGEFIDCFMSHPRTIIYEPLFAANDKIWVKSFNSDGNLLAVLQEVSTKKYCEVHVYIK